MTPPRSFEFIVDSAVLLRSGNSLAGVKTSENEFHATRAYCGTLAGIDFESLGPGTGNAFESIGVFLRRQQVADLDLHSLGEDVDDLVEAMTIDVLLENDLNRFANDRVEDLLFRKLMAARQI